MREINEEEYDDLVKQYREKALHYIPYRHVESRALIEQAGSLKLVSRGIDAFLGRARPKTSDEQPEDAPNLHDSPSARISVHRVFMNNLMPVRNEIEALIKEIVIVEDERE